MFVCVCLCVCGCCVHSYIYNLYLLCRYINVCIMFSYAATPAADVRPLLVATDTAILTLPVNDSGTIRLYGPPSPLIAGGSK